MRTRISTWFRCAGPKRFLPVSVVTLCFAVAVWATVAVTSPGLLELDGNVVVNTSGNDDWNTINLTGSSGQNRGNSTINSFIAGSASPQIFTTGGSKDPLDISNWRWSTGSVPDKDLLTNGYAAAYDSALTNNELVLYFGADRFAQNGDSNIGAWFFQQQVGPCPDATNPGCTGKASGTFSGVHSDHDIFIVSAFTKGGGVSTITVYEWNSACTGPTFVSPPTPGTCADNNLKTLSAGSNPDAFAIVNDTLLSGANAPTWPYTPKSGSAGTFPQGAFYEAGINVSELLAAQGVTNLPCFTSFLEETRSSQSTSATLKDFIVHNFPLCGIKVTKQCPTCTITGNGTAFTYTVNGTVENTGIGQLFNVTVSDSAGLTFACGTLAGKGLAGSTKNWGSTAGAGDCTGASSTFNSTANPATNQASASGDTAPSGGNTVSDQTVVITCASCQPSPNIALSKMCSTTPVVHNGEVAIRVDYTGTVQNTSLNTALNNVSVSEDDNNDGTIDVPALSLQPLDSSNNPVGSPCTSCTLSPGQFASFSGSYFPNSIHIVSPGRGDFTDKVRGGGDSALINPNCTPTPQDNCHTHVDATPVTATCPICPPGSAACPVP